MKYCNHCGKELSDEAVICVGCGCPIENKNSDYEIDSNICQYIESHSKAISILTVSAILCIFSGILLYLFLSVWIGTIFILFALFITFSVRISFKRYIFSFCNSKRQFQIAVKKINKSNAIVKTSFIIEIVSGVLLSLFIIGIIVIILFVNSLNSNSVPDDIYTFIGFLKYINSPEYCLYITTKRLQENLNKIGM